ncbi:hypothetical protein EK21DRAFT_53125, partial [Setomelanomma holmii]
PSPTCVDTPIGFTVVDAPSGKTHFRGRDFFKLNRIELRCETAPGKSTVVEPSEDAAPDLFAVEASESPSPALAKVPLATPGDAMEIDSRPSMPVESGSHVHTGLHYERTKYHQPLQHIEGNRQSLAPPSSMRSPTTLPPMNTMPPKAPSNPVSSASPAIRPIHDPPYATQPSPRESSIGVAGRPHHVNGSIYPRSPAEVSMDAIERLQTQISQNSGALAAHTRDMRRGEESFQQLEASLRRDFAAQVQRQSVDIQRVDEAVARLHLEMQSMRQALEGVSHELVLHRTEMQRAPPSQLGQAASVPDAALELMAQQMTGLAHKATEVDMLKVTIEIMKKKIHRLEQGGSAAPAPHASAHGFQSQGPAQPQGQAVTSFPGNSAAAPHDSPSLSTPNNPQAQRSFGHSSSATLPEATYRLESAPGQSSGWASVNAGTKRTYANGVESSHEGATHVLGSPKRQKTVAADPHSSYAPSQTHTPQQAYDHRDTENPASRLPAPPTLPSQQSIPESVLASQTPQSAYAPYGTQDGPSDDSWRPESQRHMEHRPRGRPRSGPGSRGGRVRKSMPAQGHQPGTPEWEREDWQGVPESQAGPDGFYNHVARASRGIARRGSGGGGGRGGCAQSDRAASLGSQGVSLAFAMGSPNDPYAHTKKSRTKPIRNADGVLIRKDGRPDMRSQSSAANLRKAHARKEGEQSAQGSPTGVMPATLHHGPSADSPGTPTPSGFTHPDPNATPGARQKHNEIMGKMFPAGLDESRKQHDYAHQVFEGDRDHTAHPRNQHHHVGQSAAAKTAIKIKKEQIEQNRVANSQSPNDGDVDMDRTEGQHHAEPEEQTPGQQIEHEEAQWREQPAPPAETEIEQVVPETQAVELQTLDSQSSATLSAATQVNATGTTASEEHA